MEAHVTLTQGLSSQSQIYEQNMDLYHPLAQKELIFIRTRDVIVTPTSSLP